MPTPQIYFLAFEGQPVPAVLCDILFTTVQEMLREKLERKDLKDDYFEGIVTTQWRLVAIGTIFGYVFSATLEYGNQKTTTSFLAKKTDLTVEQLGIGDVDLSRLPKPTYPSS